MAILIVAEHHHGSISASTRATLTAAQKIGGDIDVLVAGGEGATVVSEQAAALAGVRNVFLVRGAEHQYDLPENLAALVAGLASNYSHILAPASTFGKDFMPRVSALTDAVQVSDITEVVDEFTFVRPIYAGNAMATVKASGDTVLVTVRAAAFERAGDGGSASITEISGGEDSGLSRFVDIQETKSDRPDLGSADRVVAGGRGVGSAEQFSVIYDLADVLGAAVGASRAAVDAGYISNDHQVGQTGKVVAPDLYIALGISGAIQHLAGMKNSKIIVAVNTDENAPIFEVADYGLVADLFDVAPELAKALQS